ncbi:uncharacterized protein [Acropora muricata]|uniref:uncharacterized protein n=1 Tax=Acropora muricata TaxID=159855 RepID=UPI0034E51C49
MPMEDVFPKSVVLHFPPSIYQRTGASTMLPKLLQILNSDDLRCIQFLRSGKVRISFREEADRDRLLSEGMRLDDQAIPVTRHAEKVTVLYIRDLPYEVASDDVIDFLSTHGEVLTAERSVNADFPTLCNGNRIVKMVLNEDIPHFLSIGGYQCRVWYRGQPIQCIVCRESGHRAQDCPLSGRCRYCHQPGHMARECSRAWVQVPTTVPADVEPEESSVEDESPPPPPVDKPSDPDETSVPDKDPDKLPAVVVSDNLPAEPAMDKPPAAVIDNDAPMTDKEKPTVATENDVPMKPPEPAMDKPPAAVIDNDTPMTDKEKPTVATENDVPMKPPAKSSCAPPSATPAKSRADITAHMFSLRIAQLYPRSELPDFDNVKGKEWDTRAKAFLRRRINEIFSNKEICLSEQDIIAWTEDDVFDVSVVIGDLSGVRNYLLEFIHGIIKSYWRKLTQKYSKS